MGMGVQRMQFPPGASQLHCSPVPCAWCLCSSLCSGSDPQCCPWWGDGLCCPLPTPSLFLHHHPLRWGSRGPQLACRTPTELSQELRAQRVLAPHRHRTPAPALGSLQPRGTCSAPGLSPHLVPFPMDPPPHGARDPQVLEQGPSTALSSGEDTPICLLGRRSPCATTLRVPPHCPPCATTLSSVCRHRPHRLVSIPGSD